MSEIEKADIEPISVPADTPIAVIKNRPALSKVRRELNETELTSPAVQRLLMDDLERLDREVVELKEYKDKFHSADKLNGILQEKMKRSLSNEIINLSCFVIGSVALGYAPSLWNNQPSGYISLGFGLVLIIIGVAARIIKL